MHIDRLRYQNQFCLHFRLLYTVLGQPNFKVPQNLRNNALQLEHSKLLTNAIARPCAERNVGESIFRLANMCFQESLGPKFIGIDEQFGITTHAVDRNDDIRSLG